MGEGFPNSGDGVRARARACVVERNKKIKQVLTHIHLQLLSGATSIMIELPSMLCVVMSEGHH